MSSVEYIKGCIVIIQPEFFIFPSPLADTSDTRIDVIKSHAETDTGAEIIWSRCVDDMKVFMKDVE